MPPSCLHFIRILFVCRTSVSGSIGRAGAGIARAVTGAIAVALMAAGHRTGPHSGTRT